MEIFLIRALQLILALSLLVLVHEFGHFLFARIFKVRVEKFYLFFDWKFSLFKWKPKNSDTEYGIGWVPLGGYCKIAGMIDESMDTEQMNKPAEKWEYRSKPAWQRLLIIVGGVMFNLILALFIYSMVLFTWGDRYVDLHKIEHGFTFNEKAKEIGFEDGDIIVKIDGEEVHELYLDKIRGVKLMRSICAADEVTVLRAGKEASIAITEELGLLDMNKPTVFLATRLLPIIGEVDSTGCGWSAGLRVNDRLTSIDGNPINSWSDIKRVMDGLKLKGKTSVSIEVMRDSLMQLSANVDTTYMLGIIPAGADYPIEHITYSFLESFPAGAAYAMDVLK